MADYKSLYMQLYNGITDAIEILQAIQQQTEENFIQQEEKVLRLEKENSEEDE